MKKKHFLRSIFTFFPLLMLLPLDSVMSQSLLSFSKTEALNTQEKLIEEHPGWKTYQLVAPPFEDPFISLTIKWEGLSHSPATVFLKKQLPGDREWVLVNRDPHLGNDSIWISELLFLSSEQQSFKLLLPSQTGNLEKVSLHWFYPGNESIEDHEKTEAAKTNGSCFCPLPSILERSQWCPQNNCPSFVSSSGNMPTHLIVHHTAGTNQASDWAAVVRSIWNQHVNVNGWADIGYHYLIDPNGRVYRGRTDEQIGAHFCSTNTATLGICVMGNFVLIEPSNASLYSLLDLVSAKSCEKMISPSDQSFHPPSGLVLNHISGHRDGCATQCPGVFLYPLLPGLRELADQKFQWICMDAMPAPVWTSVAASEDEVLLQWDYPVDALLFDYFELQWRPGEEMNYFPWTQLPSANNNLNISMPSEADFFIRIRAVEANVQSPWSEEVPVFIAAISDRGGEKIQPIIFPNPVGKRLYLSLPPDLPEGKISGQIYSSDGIMVKQLQMDSPADSMDGIEVSDLSAGVYFMELNQYPDLRIPFLKLTDR